MIHVLPGQGDYHPVKNEIHGGEQVPVQGIIILKLYTNLIGKQENLPSGYIIESATNGQQGSEIYLGEKRKCLL